MAKLRWFVAGAVVALTAAAISQELAQDPEKRTWKGTVAGVPYNFRIEEWPSIASEYWNPDSEAILSPRAIGLGWGVNFAALARRVQAVIAAESAPTPRAQASIRR